MLLINYIAGSFGFIPFNIALILIWAALPLYTGYCFLSMMDDRA